MTDTIKSSKAFLNQQHKVRGLVAKYKSTRFVKGQSAPRSSRFRSGIREVLLGARAKLKISQYFDFVRWTTRFVEHQLPGLLSIPVGYEDIVGALHDPPAISLERELYWIAARITVEVKKINHFRGQAADIEHLLFRGEYENAISRLRGIEAAFGASLWSVQLRIALENQAGGLERQKRYAAEIRNVYRRGLLGFVTYHTSVRNEDRTTIAKYVDEIKARIDGQKLFTSSVKTYVCYRLTSEWPNTESGISDVLRIEQNHSIIDIYETFVVALQELVSRELSFEVQRALPKCLQYLDGIVDVRLSKVRLILGMDDPASLVCRRNTAISDALFKGQIPLAINKLRAASRACEIDPWVTIYAGYALAHTKGPRENALSEPKYIPWLIGSVVGRKKDASEAYAKLEKFAVNLRALPAVAGIGNALPLLRRVRPDDAWKPWRVGLNSGSTGVEDLVPGVSDSEFHKFPLGETVVAWKGFFFAQNMQEKSDSACQKLFVALGALRAQEYQRAVECVSSLAMENSESLRSSAWLVMLHAQFSLGNRQDVISLIAREGARGKAYRWFIPLVPSLEAYEWVDYRPLSDSLAAAIALHLLWSAKEDDVTASLVRFSVGTFLKKSNIYRPSKIFEHAERYDKCELIYFLRDVCVPHILDVSRILKSSSDVMDERQAVCATLRSIDADNADDYAAEVISISNRQAMDAGRWVVDRTRIHVDTEALSRWAAKELAEDYGRYRDLLHVDVGSPQSFDDVVRELTAMVSSGEATFTPESEADAVLVSMTHRLADEFLNNPIFGFDFYLSKRIRHQSFIGLIRGPLEFSHLITTRESGVGGYRRNEYWLGKFTSCDASTLSLIDYAFSKCASKFDETLISAKEVAFHVRSKEKPAGLFSIEITSSMLALSRAIAQLDLPLKLFIDYMASLFRNVSMTLRHLVSLV